MPATLTRPARARAPPIGGAVGPRGDGYVPGAQMTPDEAAEYHAPQLRALRDGGAELATAWTIPYAEEAVGLVRAAGPGCCGTDQRHVAAICRAWRD